MNHCAPRPFHARPRRAATWLIACLAMLVTALCGASSAHAALGAITDATFEADSYLSDNPAAVWTVGFTPSAGGALTAGNSVYVEFDGFDLTGTITATLAAGFVGTCTNPSESVNSTYVVVVLPAGCSLAALTPATLTITGIESEFNQYANAAFRVLTYADATTATPIDTGDSPNNPGGIHITAPVTYSSQTSAGAATSGGTAPSDPSSPYTVAQTNVTVLGNTGSLTLAGYVFAGWCTTNNAANPTLCTGAHYDAADVFVIAANTTLYSQWTLAPVCDPGSYLATDTCVLAPAGTFVASAGALVATPCPTGQFAANVGSTSCTLAAPGTFVDASGAAAATPCPVGRYSSAAGSTSCTLAPAGSFVGTAGATAATACAADTFTDVTGATACAPCSQGFTTNGATGQTSCTVIPTCQPGAYQLDGVCLLAPAGSFVSIAGATAATPCPVDTFTDVVGARSCTPCPSGASTNGTTGQVRCTAVPTPPSETTERELRASGTVTAKHKECVKGRKVVLRHRSGEKVGSDLIDAKGRYQINVGVDYAPGKYTVELVKKTVKKQKRKILCMAATVSAYAPSATATSSIVSRAKKTTKVKSKVTLKLTLV